MDRIPAIQAAILSQLRSSPAPRSSRDLAARHLKIEHGDEETCRRLLAPFLLAVPGVRHVPGEGWVLRPAGPASTPASSSTPAAASTPAPEPAPEPPRAVAAASETLRDFVALASDGGGPGGSGAVRAASILPVIAGEPCQEEHFPDWAAEADEGAAIAPGAAGAAGRPGAPVLRPDDLMQIVEAIGELPVICHRAAREVEPLRRACAAAGIAFTAPVLSASKLGHLVLALKANHALADLVAALALESRGPDDCRGRVRAVAAAYLALLPLLRSKGIVTLEALLEYQDMPAPPLDLSRYAFTADDLKALPATPGVYRFLDAAGAVLYVGKARNLRARVGSYFTPSAGATAKGRAVLERTRSFAVEPVASELEALLLEAALIQEHRPPLNRQFDVHERPAPYGPRLNLVVVLPDGAVAGAAAGTCTLHYLKGGRYLGRERGAMPPGRDPGSASRWSGATGRIAAAYFGNTAPGGGAAGGEGLDVDWQLVGSFLRRHGDAINVLDVDECATEEEARDRLAVLARAALGGGGRTLAR